MNAVKKEAMKLLKNLPDDVSWKDLMYEFYVRNEIEMGLKDVEEGKVVSHEEVKKRFLNK